MEPSAPGTTGGRTRAVDAATVLAAAARLIEADGIAAFSMRRLADDLGVAVTSIYWHVGGRDALFDGLVDSLLDRMTHLPVTGDDPLTRITSLARSLRQFLMSEQHLLAIAHERHRTPTLFLPVQRVLAALLAELGLVGADAALLLRALQVHVISSAVMQFAGLRGDYHRAEDPVLASADWADRELAQALAAPTDYDAVFEFGLAALLSKARDLTVSQR